MQVIRTRYYGPTDFTGSCIRAKCEGGSVRVSYDSALNSDQIHKAACDALKAKMGWTGDMVSGEFNGDTFWVFTGKAA